MKNACSFEYTETIRKMKRLHSPKYGLVCNVNVNERSIVNTVSIDGYNLSLGNIIPSYTTVVSNACTHNQVQGWGSSLSRDLSMVKAFGEFIERYCSNYNEKEWMHTVLFDSYKSLAHSGLQCLDLCELVPFADDLYNTPNFAYPKYTNDAPITWLEGKELVQDCITWVPAQKVLGTYIKPESELRYIPCITTGLACGSTVQQAIINGLYEVIERDSFMLTWLLKIPCNRIDLDVITNRELSVMYRHVCAHLVGEDQLNIFDISQTNGVCTVVTFIQNRNPDAYGLIVTSASHIDPEAALLKSLEELCQLQAFAYSKLVLDDKRDCQKLTKHAINNLYAHSLYYSTGRRSNAFDFISANGGFAKLSDLKQSSQKHYSNYVSPLTYMIQLFSMSKSSVIAVNVTKPEIKESGFYVYKTIIPEYLDLSFTYSYRKQKNKRLQELQRKYGVEINDDPHPFA